MKWTKQAGLTRRFAVAGAMGAMVAGFGRRAMAEQPAPTTDRQGRKVEASGGGKLPDDYRKIDPDTGEQKAYVVLTPEERAKGFVRPVRTAYTHLRCGYTTSMSKDIAETFAADPKFYSTGYCSHCRTFFPLTEFVWAGTNDVVGS